MDPATPADALAEIVARFSGHDANDALVALAGIERARWGIVAVMTAAEVLEFDECKPSPDADLESLVRAAAILDAWHGWLTEELPETSGANYPDRLAAEFRLDDDGRLNSDAADGILIPAATMTATGGVDKDRTPNFGSWQDHLAVSPRRDPVADPALSARSFANRVLRHTAWLPRALPSASSGLKAAATTIAPAYFRSSLADRPRGLPADGRVKIAVAPLAETGACVSFVATRGGSHYTIRLNFDLSRVESAIYAAMVQGAHLLILPEMTVGEAWLGVLPNLILDVNNRFRNDFKRAPALCWIFAGMTALPAGGAAGRNSVTLFTARGDLLAVDAGPVRQDKIVRWDLELGDQERFGLRRDPALKEQLGNLVEEDIAAAARVVVLDIDGLGRLVFLICASLAHDLPGDWLIANVRPDWVIVPVMDASICWTTAKHSPLDKWTVRRAFRAACLGRSKVVVANSLTLQVLESAEAKFTEDSRGKKKDPYYPPLKQSTVALMLDGEGVEPLHRRLETPLPVADSPVVLADDWLSPEWSELPLRV